MFDANKMNNNDVDQVTSTTLIQQAKLRQDEAWQRLVRDYSPLIYNQARLLGLAPDEATDITQEVLAAALTSIKRFERKTQQDSFRKWLKGITRNKVRTFFRDEHKQVARGAGGSQGYRQLLQVGELVASSTDQQIGDSTLLVRRALAVIEDDFQPQTWQAFWRTAIECQNSTQIAQELGMTPAAVRQAKSRVMERLRQELQRVP